MLLQFYQRSIRLPLYSVAQQTMFFVSQRAMTASTVGEWSNRASFLLLAQHLFDKGRANVKAFGDLRDRALALLVSGHDSFT
jgi:hypothetical protein